MSRRVKTIRRGSLRAVALISFGSVLWLAVGSIWFPYWWYEFFWEGRFKESAYWLAGYRYLLDQEIYVLFGLGGIAISLVIAWKLVGRRVNRWLDRFGTVIVLVCLLLGFCDGLVLYKTQHAEAILQGRLNLSMEAFEKVRRDLRNAYEPLGRIDPPIDFHFLDTERINALYSQLEPELGERERTISSEKQVGIGAGIAGPVEVKGSASRKATETSSYQRTNFSPERKAIEIINFGLGNKTVRFYTAANEWELLRYIETLQNEQNGPLDYTKLKPITPVGVDPVDQEWEAVKSEMEQTLLSADGLVLVVGLFRVTRGADGGAEFEEEFAKRPRKISFRFSLQAANQHGLSGDSVKLHVFGDIVHQLDRGNYIGIRPLAIY